MNKPNPLLSSPLILSFSLGEKGRTGLLFQVIDLHGTLKNHCMTATCNSWRYLSMGQQ
jgi:hypothetical protein